MNIVSRERILMRISARNIIKGTITSVTEGAVNGIVAIKCGDKAMAVIKSTDVMVAVD